MRVVLFYKEAPIVSLGKYITLVLCFEAEFLWMDSFTCSCVGKPVDASAEQVQSILTWYSNQSSSKTVRQSCEGLNLCGKKSLIMV